MDGDHLEYIESTGEAHAQGERNARSASWATSSPDFVREETILGMKAYVIHQKTSMGFVEAAYSPILGSAPLFDRWLEGDIEETREAVSIQFRPVSDDEVAVPNLPVRFDRATAMHNLFRGNATNDDLMDQADARMRAVREKLRALGRTE
ncbi:MAG: hypothetical protein ABJB97_11680 [Acidobacteriota bacterium]